MDAIPMQSPYINQTPFPVYVNNTSRGFQQLYKPFLTSRVTSSKPVFKRDKFGRHYCHLTNRYVLLINNFSLPVNELQQFHTVPLLEFRGWIQLLSVKIPPERHKKILILMCQY